MADVEFKDYTMQAKAEIEKRINATLHECAGEVISQTKRNSRVDTGQTKNSFKYAIDETTHTVFMGSDYQNAIWEELGTGEYALQGNGRKGGWYYVDEKGNGHYTTGKKPSRAFWKAYSGLKNKIIKRFQSVLKGL